MSDAMTELHAIQLELFARERTPRRQRPRHFLMHVIDAGDGPDGKPVVQLHCGKCGHQTDWLVMRTVSEAKRGRSCPNCNPLPSEPAHG